MYTVSCAPSLSFASRRPVPQIASTAHGRAALHGEAGPVPWKVVPKRLKSVYREAWTETPAQSSRMSHRPSQIRIFGKSLHLLAAGWTMCVGWLWLAELRQHVRRHDVLPADYAMATLVTGTISAVVLEMVALLIMRWSRSAVQPAVQRREWHHAFWWSIFPNVMLLYTAYLLIFGVD
jgi:hypothetical protein